MLIPAAHYVLVELPVDPKKGKVFIPTELKDSTQEGIVLTIGEDVKINYLKPGRRIRWHKYAEADGIFDYEKKKVCLIRDEQIMGIFE